MLEEPSPREAVPAGFLSFDTTKPGYASVARAISIAAGREVSRQCVFQWWKRRDRTGFPEGYLAPSGLKEKRAFQPEAVREWWAAYKSRVRWLKGS